MRNDDRGHSLTGFGRGEHWHPNHLLEIAFMFGQPFLFDSSRDHLLKLQVKESGILPTGFIKRAGDAVLNAKQKWHYRWH